MVLTYHGVSVDPPTLNTWLKNYKDDEGSLRDSVKAGREWVCCSRICDKLALTSLTIGTQQETWKE